MTTIASLYVFLESSNLYEARTQRTIVVQLFFVELVCVAFEMFILEDWVCVKCIYISTYLKIRRRRQKTFYYDKVANKIIYEVRKALESHG